MIEVQDIDKLKEQHGDLYAVELADPDSGEEFNFVLREPRERYDHFMKMLVDPTTRDTALKTAVASCVVQPDPMQFQEVMRKYPAFWNKLGEEVHNLAGDKFKKTVKKL